MEKYNYPKSLHDRGYAIGCIFANCFITQSPESILHKLKLSPKKPIVVFYDSPPNDTERFPRSVIEEFMEIIREFKIKNPDVQVILKPKSVTKEHKRYLGDLDVKLLGSRDIYLGDIVRIATLNVGMSIVAPVTISLIIGKPGVFYETAGNYDSPLTRYEGELVFRDKESLFMKMEEYLTGKIRIPEVPELKNYNVPDANPIEILRRYVTTGAVDQRYRLF
jgi:hypothetical protein